MLPARNAACNETLRLAMNASHCNCAPLRCDRAWRQPTLSERRCPAEGATAANRTGCSSEASPQTDEACGGCGSDRRLHDELWQNQAQLGPMNGVNALERQNLPDRSRGDDSTERGEDRQADM